ncbi:hypothetical protein BC830DRAFT_214416 [Chytriomyces sp. MP71]|nr:hypothetical protein BC830DRAFT_214416 [Chytriomyces sp. MP71]
MAKGKHSQRDGVVGGEIVIDIGKVLLCRETRQRRTRLPSIINNVREGHIPAIKERIPNPTDTVPHALDPPPTASTRAPSFSHRHPASTRNMPRQTRCWPQRPHHHAPTACVSTHSIRPAPPAAHANRIDSSSLLGCAPRSVERLPSRVPDSRGGRARAGPCPRRRPERSPCTPRRRDRPPRAPKRAGASCRIRPAGRGRRCRGRRRG